MKRFAEAHAERRRRRMPPPFRISAPAADDAVFALVEQLLAEVPEPAGRPAAAPTLDETLLADAATNLWRAQRRLAREPREPRDRQAGRYLQTCRDALTDAGLVIQDHDGDAFHSGRSIEVLAVQQEEGLTGEIVLETVRPTVYLHDRRIQKGQVIIAQPASDRVSESPGDRAIE